MVDTFTVAASLGVLFTLAPAQSVLAQRGAAPAQEGTTAARRTEAAWRTFERVHGSWQVEWNAATGTPSAIWGPGLRLAERRIDQIADARQFAQATLQRYEQLLGRGDSTFVERIGQKIRRVHVFVYDQLWNGLEVISGRADIRIHDVGVLSLFGSRAVAIPTNFDPNPAISADAALAIACREAGATPAAGPLRLLPRVRLVIWADTELAMPTTPRLAWEVRIDAPTQRIAGRSYVDARTGQVLQYCNDLHECFAGCGHEPKPSATLARAALAHALRASTRPAALDAIVAAGTPVPGAVNVSGTLRGYVNLSLDNRRVPSLPALSLVPLSGVRVVIPSTGAFAVTDDAGNFDIPHPGVVPVQIRIEFVNSRHLADLVPAPGFGTKLLVLPTVTPGTPATITLLATGAAEYDQAQTTTHHLVDRVHEYVAGLIGAALPPAANTLQASVNENLACNATFNPNGNVISFYRESGTGPSNCVNTAYRTVVEHEWGHGLDHWYGGISQTDGLSEGWGDIVGTFHSGQPRLGPNFYYSGADIRSALNTRTYPAGGGVHQQGETWMGWAWDVRTNLIAKYGSTAFGAKMAAEIILPSIVADATNQPTAVREVYLIDDTDGNLGNGTPHCAQLTAACVKRMLPNPAGLVCSGGAAPYAISPPAAQTDEQNSSNTFPFGGASQHSYMQVHGDLHALAKTITGLNFRRDGTAAGSAPKALTLQLYFGPGSYDSFGSAFLSNYSGPRTLVANGTFQMPGWAATPPSIPAPFSFRIPTSPYAKPAGADFLWEMRISGTSSPSVTFADAVAGTGDIGSAIHVPYGSGCLNKGQPSVFGATMAATTSKLAGQHTLTLGGVRARENQPAAFWLTTAPANLQFGFCAPVQVDLFGWLYSANAVSDAFGNFTLPAIGWPYHPIWIGFAWYGQAIGVDPGRVPYPLTLSTGARLVMPAPSGLRIARLFELTSATATMGTLGLDYGLVIALD